MTIELSIVLTSADGSSFEIVPRDVTGISDADQSSHLKEAGKSPYSRLLFFERNSDGSVSPSDLKPLMSYSSGVYILVNTRLTPKNKRSVFAGMAGIDHETLVDCLGTRDIDEETVFTSCVGGLFGCLQMQSKQPPSNMGNWDLVVVIPTQTKEETVVLFHRLCNMLDEFEEFYPWHKRPIYESSKVLATPTDFRYVSLMSSTTDLVSDGGEYLIQIFHSLISAIGPGLLIEAVKSLFWQRPGKKDSVLSMSVDQSFQPTVSINKNKGSISFGGVTNNYTTNINISHSTEDQNRPNDFDK